MSILLFAIFLSACGNRIDVKEASMIAVNFVTENTNEIWYVSHTKSENNNWVIHTKLFGYDCLTKIIYINNKTGAITDIQAKNECKETATLQPIS